MWPWRRRNEASAKKSSRKSLDIDRLMAEGMSPGTCHLEAASSGTSSSDRCVRAVANGVR
jgi:hypothetical protein